jgi:signal transduction histidine kinase
MVRSQAVSEDERQTKRLQALAESSQMFAEASTDLRRLLGVIAQRFSELVGEAANIRLIDGDALVPVATYHPDPETNAYLHDYHDNTPLKLGEGISGEVLATGEPYYMPQLDLEQLKKRIAPKFVSIFEKVGIAGMIVVRLRSRGINLGYLSLFRTSKSSRPPFTPDDLHLVQDLADRAALAIDNSRLLDSLERRVAERTKALQAANGELEAFAYSVSHDLRSPLRAIDGFSRMLEEDHGPQLDDDARKMLAVIRKNAQRMAHLIDDLLRLSRLGHGALEPVVEVDMRALVEALVGGLRTVNPELALEVTIGQLPKALGNAQLLGQVWTNLLDNAVKYSRNESVTRIEIDGRRADGQLRYTITDHGAGFDPKYASRLFVVFQRLHGETEFEGTGVGLALVQRIITRHGGGVWGEGRVDEGATFGFHLPERGPSAAP